ncbi:MAG: sugar porter family MFS transporter [Thermoplasmatales archaeon]|nr:sugar porter family MFS transporter [Thermoplasmatales archaeon]MCW6170715.1 sugar porter family MFS transporter [Thermoplasmatales archaeon]
MFDALDESSLKKVHLRITALSSGGSFLDGYDISIISVAILILQPQFSLTSTEITLLLGSTILGMIFGGVFIGYITDIKGRRYVYLWDMAFFILFTVLSALAANYIQLLIYRLLLGVAIGADYAITPTIIAEFSPVKHRGKLLSFSGAAWFIGAFASYGIGTVLIPLGNTSWRYMFLIGIIPAIIILLLRRDVPESPRWLLSHGENERANASMKEIDSNARIEAPVTYSKTRIGDLFRKKYMAATAFVSIFWFALDAVAYVIALDGPSILHDLGISTVAASGYATVIALLAIIGAVIAILFIDTKGRKSLTMIGFAGMVITLMLAAILFHYYPIVIYIVLLFVVFEISQELGPGITNSVYPQELYPTEIRSTAQGFGTTISRVGALFGIFVFAFVSDAYGISIGLILLAIISAVGLIVTLSLGKETAGKSLEELSEL